MLIEQQDEGNKGMFFIGEASQPRASMTYLRPSSRELVIEHTEVTDELKGKKIGNALVSHAVDYARTNHLKIIPICPFASAVLKRNPEFADVLK